MSAPDPAFGHVVALREFEALARAAMDPAAFDYVSGGSFDEITLAENDTAWRRHRLRPRVLVDVARIDPSSTMLGTPVAFPVAIAPMATQELAHPDGEGEMARAAAAAGIPFILSTTSSRSIEAVAAAAADATRWFQLYVQGELDASRALVERAEAAGYQALIVTVDLPVLGYRERDRRSGFQLPALGNFVATAATHGGRRITGLDQLAEEFRPSLDWADLAAIRSWTRLPLVLKGILTAEDARLAVDHGAAAIVVSNHGARQLDRVQATADALADIVAAVGGRIEVWVDGGIRRGIDLAIAIALGARGVLIGKPLYWALAAGGAPATERALAIVREEFEITLALLGTPTPDDIGPSHLVGPGPEGRPMDPKGDRAGTRRISTGGAAP